MVERRRFFRVGYTTRATIRQAECVWETELLDLSLQGALLKRPEQWPLDASGVFHLEFTLDHSDVTIQMDVEPTHLDEKRLGVYCHHIDIDSASHLRRLIELNAGSPELLQRELAHLLEEHVEHEHHAASE